MHDRTKVECVYRKEDTGTFKGGLSAHMWRGGAYSRRGIHTYPLVIYTRNIFNFCFLFLFFGGSFNMVSIFLFSFSLNKNRSMCKAVAIYN